MCGSHAACDSIGLGLIGHLWLELGTNATGKTNWHSTQKPKIKDARYPIEHTKTVLYSAEYPVDTPRSFESIEVLGLRGRGTETLYKSNSWKSSSQEA